MMNINQNINNDFFEVDRLIFQDIEYLEKSFLVTEKDDLSLSLINFQSSISEKNKYWYAKDTLNHKPFYLFKNEKNIFEYKYMQIASDYKVGVIVIDIDRNIADNIEAIIHCNEYAPLPNLIIKNAENGHVQLIYCLENWVCTDQSNTYKKYSSKAHNYYKMLKKHLNEVFDADDCYKNYVCKNPFFKDANVSSMRVQKYSLDELARITCFDKKESGTFIQNVLQKQTKAKTEAKKQTDVQIGERNQYIFDIMRIHAYSLYAKHSKDLNQTQFEAVLLEATEQHNERVCNPPLPAQEISTIVRSISNFCFGVLSSALGKTSEERSQIAIACGRRGGKAKADKYTTHKRKYALRLLKQGLSVDVVAKRSKLTTRTIYRLKNTQKK